MLAPRTLDGSSLMADVQERAAGRAACMALSASRRVGSQGAHLAPAPIGRCAPSRTLVIPPHAYDDAEAALRRAGRPLTRSELREALNMPANDARLFHGMVGRLPFVEVTGRTWGLVDRDVPGGRAAFEAALSALDSAPCNTPDRARVLVGRVSAVQEARSHDLMVSAYRVWKAGRAVFTPERSGSVVRRE